MAFKFWARKEKNEEGVWEIPDEPVFDILGYDGETASPGEWVEVTKKDGSTVDRRVKAERHQFPSGDRIYSVYGRDEAEQDARENAVAAKEAQMLDGHYEELNRQVRILSGQVANLLGRVMALEGNAGPKAAARLREEAAKVFEQGHAEATVPPKGEAEGGEPPEAPF